MCTSFLQIYRGSRSLHGLHKYTQVMLIVNKAGLIATALKLYLLLAEWGQTPTNYCQAALIVKKKTDPRCLSLRTAVILKQYFQLTHTVMVKTSLSHPEAKTATFIWNLCYWHERQSWALMKTPKSRALTPLLGPKVSRSLNIRRQPSGFYGTRSRNNPIWHSHREGSRVCCTDVKATDRTGLPTLWAGPPHPNIMHSDWLIRIPSFPVLCALSLVWAETAPGCQW